MENLRLIDCIIQGGAVGIAFLMIVYNWRRDKLFNKTMNNHLEHTTAALTEETKAKIKMAEVMTQLSERISGCPSKFRKK